MRLLLTRAEADAARLRGTLEAAGHAVIVSPVLVFRSLAPVVPRHLADGGTIDGLVASSARAFGPLDGLEPSPRPPPFADLPLFLVGRQTEAAARRRGLSGPAIVAADAAGLMAVLCDGRPDMHLLYLAGRDRKPDIEHALAASGHALDTLETYCAEAAPAFTPQAVGAFAGGTIDAVLHFSRRSAALFLQLCSRAAIDPRGAHHVCLSHDVAAPLRLGGCARLHVAATPDATAMRTLVETIARTR